MQASRADRMSGRIDWPAWADRTPPDDRSRGGFSVSLSRACSDIETEMGRLGVDGWRLSTAAPNRDDKPYPYASANPSDPGAVLRWSRDGDQRAIPCDAYETLRDNVREIGFYVKEKRKASKREVARGQDEFATAALPSGHSGDRPEVNVGSAEEAAEILGLATPDVSERMVEVATEERVQEAHPDKGGDAREFQRVIAAKEVLLDGQ